MWATQAATVGTDTIKTEQIDEVVVREKYAPNVTATKPVQQMNKAEIEALGLENLSDAVKKFAGVNVRDYGGTGGMKTVSVRNLGAHHTAVSLDGITISNTAAGQIDIGRYSLDNIQSLALAIGNEDDPLLSARHYASAAMLAIETERPRFDNGRHYALKAGVAVGSWGYVKPSVRWWQRMGERTSLSAYASFMRSDGMYPFTLTNVSEKTKEKRRNTDITSVQGELNAYHTFRNEGQLDVKASWYRSKRGLPGSVILYVNRSDERLEDEEFFTQASYTQALSPTLRLKARLKYVHSWNRYEDPRTEYRATPQTDVDRQDEYYGSAALSWQPLTWLGFSIAEDLFHNRLNTNIALYNNDELPYPRRWTSLTALSARLRWQRWKADANLVGTYATETVQTIDAPADRKRLSPTLSVAYRLTRSEMLYVRAMMKSTFRLPTFTDCYYRRSGNPFLNPEKATLYDLGITWNIGGHGALKYLSVTADGYYNHVTDKIVAYPSTYVWRMANFGKVEAWGADVTLTSEVGLGRDMGLTLYATYSYQSAKNKTLQGTNTYNQQLPYTPWHNANASLTWRSPWVNVGYSLTYCGKRYSSEQNKPEYRMSPYVINDLTFSRDFRLRRATIHTSLALNNLFNEQYDIVIYYPMPGRSVRATVRIEL